MPEELSPEEKLLRLIKGDDKITPIKPETTSGDKDAKKGSKKISAPKTGKNNSANKNNKGDGNDKKTDAAKPVQSAEASPIDKQIRKKLAQDKNLKIFKSSIEKKQTVIPEIKSEPDKKTAKVSSTQKIASTAKKTQTQAKAKPARPQDKLQAQPQPAPQADKQDKHAKPSVNMFIHTLRFIVSGFGIICWMLLVILILSIGTTVWHVRNISLREYIVPDILRTEQVGSESPAPEEDIKLPKPFPYFAEQISRKQLFKLVKPPPPPKPPEPKRKEPEKPKVKIETLTRHFVLQGIVYDIGPPQAIIFNKKENKTMFLGNNEMLTDSVRIKKILRGKVILEYEDQTQEMTF
ncbi:hypothetical protein J7L67_05135 [bacterium]|nr:hypothetical protein [bacterium]